MQNKVAGEGGAGIEDDLISQVGVIQRVLEIVTGFDNDGGTRGGDIGRV